MNCNVGLESFRSTYRAMPFCFLSIESYTLKKKKKSFISTWHTMKSSSILKFVVLLRESISFAA